MKMSVKEWEKCRLHAISIHEELKEEGMNVEMDIYELYENNGFKFTLLDKFGEAYKEVYTGIHDNSRQMELAIDKVVIKLLKYSVAF